MKGSSTIAFAAGLLATCAEAIQLHKRTDGPPRAVGFPIRRREVANPLARDRLRRKRDTVTVSLDNEETLYLANVSLGTPAQSIELHIDTGSSDLWVNTPDSDLCSGKHSSCSAFGTYSANDSSTYSFLASNFNITYQDGSGASGDYVTDILNIGGVNVTDMQFGIGYTSTSAEGILGIGYQINEVQVGVAGLEPYANLPAAMVKQGLINSNAYSLWLNDLDASTGSILFGGVDTDQFTGTLETIPVQKEAGNFYEFLVTLTGMSLGGTTLVSDLALAVLLDSGTSLTYLPNTITEAIYEAVGADYDEDEGAAYVPCNIASNSSTLDFTFSTPSISVSMAELTLDIEYTDGSTPKYPNGDTMCLFGIAPAGSSTSVLGDTFLRSAYLVYDLANNEISMAQTNFNATGTNVQEITTGTTAVPSASIITDSVTATAGVIQGAAITGTVTFGSSLPTATSGALRTGAPQLGAVGAVAAGMAWAFL